MSENGQDDCIAFALRNRSAAWSLLRPRPSPRVWGLRRTSLAWLSSSRLIYYGRDDWIDSPFGLGALPPRFRVSAPLSSANQLRCFSSGRLFNNGRDDWIRTSDFYVPNVALYQAELRPDSEDRFYEFGRRRVQNLLTLTSR